MAREHTQVWRCRFLSHLVGITDVRFGSKADIRVAKSHVRFTPKAGISLALKNAS
jgi:hypothetical protein